MKQLIGKTIEGVEKLESGVVKLTLDEGTLLVKVLALPSELESDEDAPAAKAPVKEDKKPVAKAPVKEEKKPAKKTWEDLVDMDEDDLKELIEDDELDTDADDFEDDEEGLREAIAEELEIEIPKKSAKKDDKKAPVKEEAKDDLTWDDLKEMDSDELGDLIDDEDLDVDVDDFDDDEEGLRKAVAKELKIEVPKKKK